MKITILTPVYNDWKSASKLIEEINTIIKDLDAEFSLVIVNDASTEEKPTSIFNTENLISVEILNIRNNQGHGRCICLLYTSPSPRDNPASRMPSSA